MCVLFFRVVLCAKQIPLDVLFAGVPPLLRSLTGGDPGSVMVIRSARVPLVKWRYEAHVSVDIVFGSVDALAEPDNNAIQSIDFLLSVGQRTKPCVNGLRTTLEVLKALSITPSLHSSFTCALRVVKYWAWQRRIYNGLLTYPNGVVLAIMMARLCQQAVAAEVSTEPASLLRYFFSFYADALSQYPVPPIALEHTTPPPPLPLPGGVVLSASWDVESEMARSYLLQVVNPAFPYVNSAHAIGRTGLRIFAEELRRGKHLFQHQQEDAALPVPIDQLSHPFTFSSDYHHFIQLHVGAVEGGVQGEDEERMQSVDGTNPVLTFREWKGMVESRIRYFVYCLEVYLTIRPHPIAETGEQTSASLGQAPPHYCNYWFGIRSSPSTAEELAPHVELAFHHLLIALEESVRSSRFYGTVTSVPCKWSLVTREEALPHFVSLSPGAMGE